MTTLYPIRLNAEEKRQFQRAARSNGMTLAEFMRQAAREKAQAVRSKPACLSYTDIQISSEAAHDPKEYFRKKVKAKYEGHRR